MRFRQVHLDFHTSEAIPEVGSRFSKQQFQEMLQLGHVDSITVFSKCHHGWSYHPTKTNEMHPNLMFDLLGAQIEAAHEIGVLTPVYLSAGLDQKEIRRHPEWLIRDKDGRASWPYSLLAPGFHHICMNSPYLDLLIPQIEEAVTNYDADGIFLDIVGVRSCWCHTCLAEMSERDLDPMDAQAVEQQGERIYANYTNRVHEAIESIKPGMPIFHNGGHIRRGRRDLASMNTHLELESLPTGGYSYDHFPLSARYVQNLGLEFLGMTGKFHTTWGEFGGYKHPNALRYETALSIANGACCSVGDQLHPNGLMDPATYRLIGVAYREVESKEAWCTKSQNIADVALLSTEAVPSKSESKRENAFTGSIDAGAVRMLLEGKILFDVIDTEEDFSKYRVLILPDAIRVNSNLAGKLDTYLASGGKIMATGESGLAEDRDEYAIDLGARWLGPSEFSPTYFRPLMPFEPLGEASFVLYAQGYRVELTTGEAIARRETPYFNRTHAHFCSHQHAPSQQEDAGPALVVSKNGALIPWRIFEEYASVGSLPARNLVLAALRQILEKPTLSTDLPAQGIVTLTRQSDQHRYVQHTLYGSPVKRGKGIEVIEDLVPIRDVTVMLGVPEKVLSVTLQPQDEPLPWEALPDGIQYTIPNVTCHQMVSIEYV